MADLITLLTEPLYVVDADPDEFTRLVADELGDHGSPADGFDALLLEAASAFDAAGTVSAAFDPDEAEAAAALPAFSVDEETPLADELGGAVSDGDTALGNFDTDFGTAAGNPEPVPPPQPSPVPPIVGGGGGPVDHNVCDPWPCTL